MAIAFQHQLQDLLARPFSAEELGLLLVALQRQKRELTTPEAALYLGVKPVTVRHYIATGRLQRSRHGHVSRASLDSFLLTKANEQAA